MSNGFFNELRRRVLPTAGTYIAIAWLVTGIAGFYPDPAPRLFLQR
jgi:hypothetical protein